MDGAWDDNLNYNGYVVGVGVKTLALERLINQPLYAFAEFNYAGYDSRKYSVINKHGNSVNSSNLGLSATTGLMGVGYIF